MTILIESSWPFLWGGSRGLQWLNNCPEALLTSGRTPSSWISESVPFKPSTMLGDPVAASVLAGLSQEEDWTFWTFQNGIGYSRKQEFPKLGRNAQRKFKRCLIGLIFQISPDSGMLFFKFIFLARSKLGKDSPTRTQKIDSKKKKPTIERQLILWQNVRFIINPHCFLINTDVPYAPFGSSSSVNHRKSIIQNTLCFLRSQKAALPSIDD